MKIAIIIPYFGKLPQIYSLWETSAIHNSNYNFIIFTDDKHIKSQNNIIVINMTFECVKNLIKEKLGDYCVCPTAYKLCDYRPAFGLIFKDYIKSYDIIGWGDIDLIYGNLSKFLSNYDLEKYCYFSGYGHLTLHKNNTFCNTYFINHSSGFLNYKEVFASPQNYIFDEYRHKGLSDMWLKNNPELVWKEKKFDDIFIPSMHYNFVSCNHEQEYKHLLFEYDYGNLYRIYLKNGKIIKEETMYVHFQKRNFMQIHTISKEHYLIVPNKFIEITDINIRNIKKLTRIKGGEILNRKLYVLKLLLKKCQKRFKILISNQ